MASTDLVTLPANTDVDVVLDWHTPSGTPPSVVVTNRASLGTLTFTTDGTGPTDLAAISVAAGTSASAASHITSNATQLVRLRTDTAGDVFVKLVGPRG